MVIRNANIGEFFFARLFFRSLIRTFTAIKTTNEDKVMKMSRLIPWLLCLPILFAACEKQEPELFDEASNGAYFDYEYAADYNKTLNFSNYIVGYPDTVSMTLKVKLMGYLEDEARTLSVKTKAIAGYELAGVSIDETVFANKEYEKDIEVKVARPEAEDRLYAVCIYLDSDNGVGASVSGKDSINLFVTCAYERPEVWYSHMDTYLGGWSREKHIFLAEHTGDNHFYDRLFDSAAGLHLFDSIVALNVSAVNVLLAQEPAEAIVPDLPILKETDYPAYIKPYFWDEHEALLGLYRASKFCRFTTLLGGSNTRDIAALYASDEGQQQMVKRAAEFHNDDVLEMLNLYYGYAEQGYTIGKLKQLFWVQMRNDADYNVRIPYWWDDPHGLGTADIVKHYFGEYDADKYQFMLKTMMKEDGEENFVAASLLPFVRNVDAGTYEWDTTQLGTKNLAGEERIKECYRIIKAKNDSNPPSRRHDFPKLDI